METLVNAEDTCELAKNAGARSSLPPLLPPPSLALSPLQFPGLTLLPFVISSHLVLQPTSLPACSLHHLLSYMSFCLIFSIPIKVLCISLFLFLPCLPLIVPSVLYI